MIHSCYKLRKFVTRPPFFSCLTKGQALPSLSTTSFHDSCTIGLLIGTLWDTDRVNIDLDIPVSSLIPTLSKLEIWKIRPLGLLVGLALLKTITVLQIWYSYMVCILETGDTLTFARAPPWGWHLWFWANISKTVETDWNSILHTGWILFTVFIP